MVRKLMVIVCVGVLGTAADAATPSAELIEAMIEVESGGDLYAVGDKDLEHQAYGCLQVRQPAVDDVNRRYDTDLEARDCLGSRVTSVWVLIHYMRIYATEERLDREPTAEDMARIWNGGPSGYKKDCTREYWQKVKKVLEKEG